MKRQGIDPAYNQPTDMGNEGTRQQAGKDSSNPCDAKGNPGHFTRNQTSVAVLKPDSVVDQLHDLQNGSNAGMSAGFDPEIRSYITLAPRRGFDNKKSNNS